MHLDLDTFFVSVERLRNSRLSGKPLIVGSLSDRGVVSACSYETRQFGVYSGMSMKMARTLCPESIVIQGDFDLYVKYSRMVTDVIAEKAPVYEKMSIDEHYLDLTGMDRFYGIAQWARELKSRITNETGLPISYGLSLNKTVAKIATGEAKPNGALQVEPERVCPFMDPLSIRKIPGIGVKSFQLLRTMGVSTIFNLRSIPSNMVERVLGKNGTDIWKKAHGIDSTPVKPYVERQSIGTEHTFEHDTIDVERMLDLLVGMTEQLAFELRQKRKVTSCVTVKIRYSNFDTHTKQAKIPYTSFDHLLVEVVKQLFAALYNRRMLVRLIGVKFSDLAYGAQQLDLFETRVNIAQLYQNLDKLKATYGDHIVQRASCLKIRGGNG
jgi:DNA polymerase-4